MIDIISDVTSFEFELLLTLDKKILILRNNIKTSKIIIEHLNNLIYDLSLIGSNKECIFFHDEMTMRQRYQQKNEYELIEVEERLKSQINNYRRGYIPIDVNEPLENILFFPSQKESL
jgi:hypothetical protein